ncbi:MAG TPA: DUF4058 family protein [Anaerolineae bacterium]
MKSPFPGMDPYLEDKSRWSSVHTRLIVSMSDQLADAVAPHFFVEIEQRVYIVTPNDPESRQQIVPDLYAVLERQGEESVSAVAPGAIVTPTLVEPLYELEIRDRYIEIRDTESREVVTTLELLSPFNKTPGHVGYKAFQRKRQQVMASNVHWIEIDLLRAGERPAEVSGKSDYYALLKRGETSGPYEVWYFDLRDRMPSIAVPLRSPFDDVPLDLQAAFDEVYRRARYANSIDYMRSAPPPPLRPAEVVWAADRIQSWRSQRQSTT